MNEEDDHTSRDALVSQVHRAAYPIDLHLDSFSFAQAGGFDYEKGDWVPTKGRFLLWFTQTFFLKGQNAPLYYHVSGPDLTVGGYGGACASAHANVENLTWLPFGDPWKRWQAHKVYLEQLAAENPSKYKLTRTPQEVDEAKAEGKISLILSVEGAHILGPFGKKTQSLRIQRIKEWAADGVAYVTLNHFSNTDISMAGYASLNPLRWTKGFGLSNFGRQVLKTFIDNGVLIDLTHTSTRGISDVCNICAEQGVPVIVSHGGSRTLTRAYSRERPYRLRRVLEDDAIRKIVETGGCISVILAPYFLQVRRTAAGAAVKDEDLKFVVEYYERFAALIANISNAKDPWNHLSFGSDFDGGIASIPTGMKTGANLPALTKAMLDAGWPQDRIERVYSGNFLRVWGAAKKKALVDHVCVGNDAGLSCELVPEIHAVD